MRPCSILPATVVAKRVGSCRLRDQLQIELNGCEGEKAHLGNETDLMTKPCNVEIFDFHTVKFDTSSDRITVSGRGQHLSPCKRGRI